MQKATVNANTKHHAEDLVRILHDRGADGKGAAGGGVDRQAERGGQLVWLELCEEGRDGAVGGPRRRRKLGVHGA